MSLLNIGNLTKLASLLSLGKGIIDKTVFQRLLTGIAAVAGLSIIAGMLVGVLLLGVLYAIYFALVHQAGLDPHLAMFTIGIIIFIIAAFLIYKIYGFIKKIATFSSMLSSIEDPVTPMNAIQAVFHAFMDGIKGASKSKNNNNAVSNVRRLK